MKWRKHVQRRRKGEAGFPIVEVIWNDALSQAVDWEEEITHRAMPTVTVGYLIYQDEHVVTLMSIINETHVGNGLTLPKSIVETVRYLDVETE